jgi:hypothetical protein
MSFGQNEDKVLLNVKAVGRKVALDYGTGFKDSGLVYYYLRGEDV